MRIIFLWLLARYRQTISSIAFYPAIIALGFLILSAGVLLLDFSDFGQKIKSDMHWLSLKDATTARSIISSITAGIISLAVFSFSMVMIVLNQAASQMSNRVLDKLIGNRFQQIVLGIYIGTIVYALFVLSTIRDLDSELYIPALSTYLLILITVFDIFLFIYFLHYITQSVKYEVIIQRIYDETKEVLQSYCCLTDEPKEKPDVENGVLLNTVRSGIYEGFNTKQLLKTCKINDLVISFLVKPGTYILNGMPLLKLNKPIDEDVRKQILGIISIVDTETIQGNYLYGFRQLMEVAIKALSPGINDPGTAVSSMRALFRLLRYRLRFFPDPVLKDEDGVVRLITLEVAFQDIFTDNLFPIWDYGKNDRMLLKEMHHLLMQLNEFSPNPEVSGLFRRVTLQMHEGSKYET